MSVLRVVDLLEDKPSPQSEVQSALEQVYNKDVSVILRLRLRLRSISSSQTHAQTCKGTLMQVGKFNPCF